MRLAVMGATLTLLGQGCVLPFQRQNQTPNPVPDQMMQDSQIMEGSEPTDDEMMGADKTETDDGSSMKETDAAKDSAAEMPKGPLATFVPFTQSGYDTALASDTPVVLFFYANWCPFCLAQEPIFRDVVAQTDFSLHTFRVNFRDDATDANETSLAKKFNIFTQHTFVFLNRDGNEVDRVVGTLTADELRVKFNALR